jgi:hypothetical protein
MLGQNTTTKTTASSSYQKLLSKLIDDCKNEPNIDKRIEILNDINSRLLEPDQVKIPSELTDDYIDVALHKIQAKLLLD